MSSMPTKWYRFGLEINFTCFGNSYQIVCPIKYTCCSFSACRKTAWHFGVQFFCAAKLYAVLLRRKTVCSFAAQKNCAEKLQCSSYFLHAAKLCSKTAQQNCASINPPLYGQTAGDRCAT